MNYNSFTKTRKPNIGNLTNMTELYPFLETKKWYKNKERILYGVQHIHINLSLIASPMFQHYADAVEHYLQIHLQGAAFHCTFEIVGHLGLVSKLGDESEDLTV